MKGAVPHGGSTVQIFWFTYQKIKKNPSVRFKNIHKKILAFHSLTMPKPFCLQTLKDPSNQNSRRKTSFGPS